MKKLIDVTEADRDKLVWVKDKSWDKWILAILDSVSSCSTDVSAYTNHFFEGITQSWYEMAKPSGIEKPSRISSLCATLNESELKATPDEIIGV